MGSSIFSEARTRSRSTLPEAPVELSRSPLKDARLAVRNRSKLEVEAGNVGAKEAEEDEMNLSPKKLGDKRSPSPSTSTDWPRLKRFKLSPTGSDVENRPKRKRSATTSKPKSSSGPSTRHQSPAVLPKKERARSVPVFPSFCDFPYVDIRDIPTSPTRRPPPSWEPKLKMASGSLFPPSKTLESIPDDADAEREATIDPARDPHTISTEASLAPAPFATDTLAVSSDVHAVPLSPLTPLPETLTSKKRAETVDNTEDRFTASGWGQDLLTGEMPKAVPPTVEGIAITKPARSRLPRLTNATASSSKAKPHPTRGVAPPLKAASTKPLAVANQTSVFDVLMHRTEKDKGKEKVAVNGKVETYVLKSGDKTNQKKSSGVKGKGRSSANVEVKTGQTSSIKGKMKPRTKPQAKPASIPHLVIEDEEEDLRKEPSNVGGTDDSPAYPLQPLPMRKSPSPLDFGPLPPKSSSPVISPDIDERMFGVNEAILTADDIEMQGEDQIAAERQPTLSMENREPALMEPLPNIKTDIATRVPSPLFSEPTTTAPSPLFSEPGQHDRDDFSQNDFQHIDAPDNLIDGAVPVYDVPMQVVVDSPQELDAKFSPRLAIHSRAKRQKAALPSLPPRTTRSAASKVPTTVAEGLTSGSAKKGASRKTGRKAVNKVVASSGADAAPSAIESPPSSTNPPVPRADAEFSGSQTLPVFNEDGESLSELSDLTDELGDVEVPLKGDGGEDVETETPSDANILVESDVSSRISQTKTADTEENSKRISPRRQMPKSSEAVLKEPSASFSVVSPSQSSNGTGANTQTSRLARSTGSNKKSAIPVLSTPVRKSTGFKSLAAKDNRPGSAPSSPTKLTKSYSMFSYVPVMPHLINSDTSVLGRLDHALAALAKPPPAWEPSRPNTSMGFNRDDPDSSIEFDRGSVDSMLEKGNKRSTSTIGLGRPSKASTSSSSQLTSSASSSSKALAQSKMSQFLPAGTGPGLQKNKPAIMRGGRFPASMSSGVGNRFPVGLGSLGSRGKKASQKTTLPSVIASPVKGRGIVNMNDDIEMNDADVTLPDISMSGNQSDMDISELDVSNGQSKGKARDVGDSLVMSRHPVALSQSMSALPSTTSTPMTGLMGPPPPPMSPPRRAGLRSSSSSYPSSTTSKPQAPPKFVPVLTVLEGCTVFVDVWMSDGQDTSSLYIEIAKDLGARVVKRIGPMCTHVVYTSGRERTVDQYFALDEARRPKAVGASWLRDCRQAAARLDEGRYLVDLEEHKPDPTSKLFSLNGDKDKRHKRRQSYIPKICGPDDEDADISVDESNTSMVDDELTPLERARLRQSTAGSSSRK
ncbi:hypothetical protein J3R30DRAFT_3449799 [Lentinula aciculospora]|uniref:BRCT domain-containing protein n=1 Tax=Lentinula aciculospora TaxID=153920 RepID=A0A9W9DSJ7_9AGAR|nr:hypothetical protein J3R30DRAFT_3449799 [Lentinula aciculospora]